MLTYRACLVWPLHIQRVIFFDEEPEMEYGRTHKHSFKRARQTHRKIRNN